MASYANDVLVETDWLAEHAKDPKVRVFEVDVDTTAYDQGHVAAAIGLNWKTDLQQHPVRDLIDKKQLEALLSKSGVTPDTTIVAYGDNNNWFAAWFFWLLKYYGHKDVRSSTAVARSGSPRAGLSSPSARRSSQANIAHRARTHRSAPCATTCSRRSPATERRSSMSARRRSTRASCWRRRTFHRRVPS